MTSTALEGGSAWVSRMTLAVQLTWTASGRADLMTALGAGKDKYLHHRDTRAGYMQCQQVCILSG